MPQQPASRSITVAPGTRDSSALAGAAFALEVFLEQEALARDHARAVLQLAAQQRRRIIPDRRQTAWLDEHERVAARGQIVKRVHVGGRLTARLSEQPLRNQR